jgi:hypothetical protein
MGPKLDDELYHWRGRLSTRMLRSDRGEKSSRMAAARSPVQPSPTGRSPRSPLRTKNQRRIETSANLGRITDANADRSCRRGRLKLAHQSVTLASLARRSDPT